MSRIGSPFSLLGVVIAAGLLMMSIQNRAPTSASSGVGSAFRPAEPCLESMQDSCEGNTAVREAGSEVVLSSASVCVDVGYLCAELEATGSQRIIRWPKDTGILRVRIPPPPGVDPERARELQRAAVLGVQYWQRRPFDLHIDSRPISTEPADIVISWGNGLSGSQLGLTRVGWSLERGEVKFEVLGLALATRNPANANYELSPEQVLLTAAHEMGHALGLPHSDSERDVMYPTNTARSLSTRDFRTLDALYRLPNGAEIGTDR